MGCVIKSFVRTLFHEFNLAEVDVSIFAPPISICPLSRGWVNVKSALSFTACGKTMVI